MLWVFMNVSLEEKEEYDVSTGRPRVSRGLLGSSSEERMMRRGGREGSVGWWMYGTVVRDERREIYEGGYICVWMSTMGGEGAMVELERVGEAELGKGEGG